MNEECAGVSLPPFRAGKAIAKSRLSVMYPKEADIVVLRFDVGLRGKSHVIEWTWDESLVEEFFMLAADQPSADAESASQLRGVALRMPFDVIVRLGAAQLDVSELAGLREGDVIVLDQRVSERLDARVQDRTLFQGWPGKTGNRQSFLIEACQTSDSSDI